MKRSGWLPWLFWAIITTLVTLLLLSLRGSLEKAHFVLAYLLLVLAGSVGGGHRVGLTLAAASFVLFDWFFLPPYNTFAISNPLDWFVLIAFLIVSVVAAQLLHRLQRQAQAARERAAEIDRFAVLGAETLNVASAADALTAIAGVMRVTLGLSACRIDATPQVMAGSGADSLATWVAETGHVALRLRDGTTHLSETREWAGDMRHGVREVLLPLRVRDRNVGVLHLEAEDFALDASQQRLLTALAYYAALAVERVRLEAEAGHAVALREADRVKTALLASVSHDLRTPLTTIKALAHDLGPADERAAIIEQEADRLNRMVADLLDLSRVQSGTPLGTIELNPVDDLVGAVLQRVSGAMVHRQIRVQLEDGGTLLVGRFDLAASVRILVNLLDNANKYAPAGAEIELTAMRRGDWIELTVADRGPGVAEAERERMFEPFYRPVHATPDAGSAGLGLAIARGLAEAQGGALRYSARPGGGSDFILSLPAADLPVHAIDS